MPTDAPQRSGKLRLATWNVEWFTHLFDDDDRLLADAQPSARHKTTRAEQIGAIGLVMTALDADGLLIIEAPDTNSRRATARALENFARHFGLRTRKALIGFTSETEQEIAFLYDPDRITARHDPVGDPVGRHGSRDAPRFDGTFRYDLDTDATADLIRFSKPPLELALTTPEGRSLRLIGVHAKSKAPHGARDAAAVQRLSILNRRKQLAQCIWIRARVEQHLAAGESLVVMGDFNDGPGIDEFESLFDKSGVEIVLAPDADPSMRLYDPHAAMALCSRIGFQPSSARFWLDPQKRYFEALLDFAMVSPDLRAARPDWRIRHPFNDPGIQKVPELSQALLQASDHFPVTLDLGPLPPTPAA